MGKPVICLSKIFRFLFGLIVAALLCCQDLAAGEMLTKLENEVRALIESSKQSVVTVTAIFAGPRPAKSHKGAPAQETVPSREKPSGYTNIGTGVVFDDQSHIVTRSTIVDGAEFIYLTLSDGHRLEANLVGSDANSGFAVLKVDKHLEPVRLQEEADILPGSLCLIMGNSLGVYPSVSFGTITPRLDDGMLQLAASLRPGTNGSPLINFRGEVIGLLAGNLNPKEDSQIYTSMAHYEATPVAYPSHWIRRVCEDIIEFGYVRQGWIGVVGYHDQWRGPKIREIKENSPAERAGLIQGDVIVKFSYQTIQSIGELARMVKLTAPGKDVNLEYLRGSQKASTTVKIGERQVSSSAKAENMQGLSTQNDPAVANALSSYQLAQQIEYMELELRRLKKQLLLLSK